MATKKGTKAQADSVKAAHAKTGKAVSPTEDPTDHSTTATALAGQIDPKDKSGAVVNAKSMDAVSDAADAQDKRDQEAADQGLAGKFKRSELFFVNDHVNGGGPYVGISPQNDPKASDASKRLSSVSPLGSVAPRTGLVVRPKDGDAFTIGEGFGPDATPADWARVTRPDGKPLFA